jgi:hypothetical protein
MLLGKIRGDKEKKKRQQQKKRKTILYWLVG